MKYIDLITALSNAKGAPGFEEEVVEVLQQFRGSYSMQVDSMHNTYFNLQSIDSSKPTVMLDAHLDEVALMVKGIDAHGLITLQTLGGWMNEHIAGQTYFVRNRWGEYIRGICTSKPIHFLTPAERERKIELQDLKIDVGVRTREEAIEVYGIEVGQPIVPATQAEVKSETGFVLGKAFDDRIGVALSVAIMNELADELDQLPYNLVAAFSTQEEVGLRGAQVTAQRVKPQMAFVFEGCPSDDFTSSDALEQGKLGFGPQIRHRDVSYISNSRIIQWLQSAAEVKNIPLQHAVREGGGTNAGSIHLAQQGIPCGVISVPARYVHSHASYICYQDFEDTLQLMLATLRGLTQEDIDQFELRSY